VTSPISLTISARANATRGKRRHVAVAGEESIGHSGPGGAIPVSSKALENTPANGRRNGLAVYNGIHQRQHQRQDVPPITLSTTS
jgi:hypothetical protein